MWSFIIIDGINNYNIYVKFKTMFSILKLIRCLYDNEN